jgi:hypothetical protein
MMSSQSWFVRKPSNRPAQARQRVEIAASPSIALKKTHLASNNARRRGDATVNVELLLSPRQSRGITYFSYFRAIGDATTNTDDTRSYEKLSLADYLT